MCKFYLLLISLYLLQTFSAYAYIDPGIVSMFLQAIVATFLGVLAYLSLYWQKFKSVIKKIFNKIDKKNK